MDGPCSHSNLDDGVAAQKQRRSFRVVRVNAVRRVEFPLGNADALRCGPCPMASTKRDSDDLACCMLTNGMAGFFEIRNSRLA